jgi:L-amino acid N-acyltransferase YncA
MNIEFLRIEHWPEVKEIYEKGIATGQATFQTAAPEWDEWDRSHVSSPRLVMVNNNKVVAWAALTPVSGRCVYAGVAEVSVYVDPESQGKGIGKQILQQLILESEQQEFWTLQAGIFPENKASLKIHEQLGFRILGEREKIGKMNGVWRNTVLLERRSKIAGQ